MATRKSFAGAALTLAVLVLALAMSALWLLKTGDVAHGATVTVTKTGDTNDGVCDGDCSLREAIVVARVANKIDIPEGTYTLTVGSALVIDKFLILEGAGRDLTIIQAATGPGLATDRVFTVAGVTASFADMTIRYGNPAGDGGGIHSSGTVILVDTAIRDNSASSGGGIHMSQANNLIMTDSLVSGNAAGNYGGGIYMSTNNTLTMTNSLVSGNAADSLGGGIYMSQSNTLTMTNSLVSDNGADYGGGIFAGTSSVLTLSDTSR